MLTNIEKNLKTSKIIFLQIILEVSKKKMILILIR